MVVVLKKSVFLQPNSTTEFNDRRSGSSVWFRIHACHAWGREFEPRPDRRENG